MCLPVCQVGSFVHQTHPLLYKCASGCASPGKTAFDSKNTVEANRTGLDMATSDEGSEKNWFCFAPHCFKSAFFEYLKADQCQITVQLKGTGFSMSACLIFSLNQVHKVLFSLEIRWIFN